MRFSALALSSKELAKTEEIESLRVPNWEASLPGLVLSGISRILNVAGFMDS